MKTKRSYRTKLRPKTNPKRTDAQIIASKENWNKFQMAGAIANLRRLANLRFSNHDDKIDIETSLQRIEQMWEKAE